MINDAITKNQMINHNEEKRQTGTEINLLEKSPLVPEYIKKN